MVLTDYFYSTPSMNWKMARQCGIEHGVIRLPETEEFDLDDFAHWKQVYERFLSYGITPLIIEPMPNVVHDHIKIGDEQRDACIERVIRMFPIMNELNIRMICFNFMAHIGWLRTEKALPERGGAQVTGFDLKNFIPKSYEITQKKLWDNYEYFMKAILPEAEKYQIRLALHPDDPPLPALGHVARIMVSYENIKHALEVVPSDMLGVTMCQATYYIMGEDLYKVIPALAEKIFFVHFRNVTGKKECFRETFHDNGDISMADMIQLYLKYCPDAPIRVDHVPTMAGENNEVPGYGDLGRLFALGYLRGLLERRDNYVAD